MMDLPLRHFRVVQNDWGQVRATDHYLRMRSMCLMGKYQETILYEVQIMVPAEGFEPPTPGSEDRCSIQLSHAGTQTHCSMVEDHLYYPHGFF